MARGIVPLGTAAMAWRGRRIRLIILSPFLSSSFFLAASSLCFRMMASRARSALACSVFPARCIFMYLSFAFCFSISSLFKGNTPITRVSRQAHGNRKSGAFQPGKTPKLGNLHQFSSTGSVYLQGLNRDEERDYFYLPSAK